MKTRILMIAVVLCSVASAMGSPVMYTVAGVTDELITINLSNGSASVVGPIGFDSWAWGLAFSPVPIGPYPAGSLFGVETSTDLLYTFNLNTGAATPIGNGLGTEFAESLTFDLTGNLFTMDGSSMYQVNPLTGVATFLSNGPELDGLDVAPVDVTISGGTVLPAGTIFGVDSGGIAHSVNPFTGSSVNLGNVSQDFADETIAFAPDGTLYGLGTPVSDYDLNLISLNPLSGTFIGSTGYANLWGSAIIPEPATICLLGLGGLLLARNRRFNKK
jgi:hypothetical protein